MAYKKTNEVYFGDSFNRPSTIACYNAEGKHLFDGRISACDLSYNPDSYTEASITCDLSNKAESVGYAITKIDCVDQVESLTDKIRDIQAQIDDLKQNYVPKKGADKLRSALITLNYKREI